MQNEFYFFKKNLSTKSETFFNLFYLIRYFPLIVFSHDWYLFDSYGIYAILKNFSLAKTILATNKTISAFILLIAFIAVSLACLIYYFYLEKIKPKDLTKPEISKNSFLLSINFYLHYFLSFFILDFCFSFTFDRKCTDKDANYSDIAAGIQDFSATSYLNCLAFQQAFSPIAFALMVLNIFFVYFFEVISVSPHRLKLSDLTGSLCGIRKGAFFFPFLSVFLIFEKLFLMNRIILIVKMILRVFILFYYLIKLKNGKRVTNLKIEIYIESFCAVSIFLELIYFYFIYEIKELQMLNLAFNAQEYSIFYSQKFLLMKILVEIILAVYISQWFFTREINTVVNFYGKINTLYESSDSNNIIHNLIFYVCNFEKLNRSVKEKFLLNFLFYLNKHKSKEKCLEPNCECRVVFKSFKTVNLCSLGNKSHHKHLKPKLNCLDEIFGNNQETNESSLLETDNLKNEHQQNFHFENYNNNKQNLNNDYNIQNEFISKKIEDESQTAEAAAKNNSQNLDAAGALAEAENNKNIESNAEGEKENFYAGFLNKQKLEKTKAKQNKRTLRGASGNLIANTTIIEQDLKMKLLFISVIINFFKNSTKKSKSNNSKLSLEHNFLDILITIFIKKNYITGLYKIKRLLSFKNISNSLAARSKLNLIKLEVIENYNKQNKFLDNETRFFLKFEIDENENNLKDKKINKKFNFRKNLLENYEKNLYFEECLETNEKCFEMLKSLNDIYFEKNLNNKGILSGGKNLFSSNVFREALDKLLTRIDFCQQQIHAIGENDEIEKIYPELNLKFNVFNSFFIGKQDKKKFSRSNYQKVTQNKHYINANLNVNNHNKNDNTNHNNNNYDNKSNNNNDNNNNNNNFKGKLETLVPESRLSYMQIDAHKRSNLTEFYFVNINNNYNALHTAKSKEYNKTSSSKSIRALNSSNNEHPSNSNEVNRVLTFEKNYKENLKSIENIEEKYEEEEAITERITNNRREKDRYSETKANKIQNQNRNTNNIFNINRSNNKKINYSLEEEEKNTRQFSFASQNIIVSSPMTIEAEEGESSNKFYIHKGNGEAQKTSEITFNQNSVIDEEKVISGKNSAETFVSYENTHNVFLNDQNNYAGKNFIGNENNKKDSNNNLRNNLNYKNQNKNQIQKTKESKSNSRNTNVINNNEQGNTSKSFPNSVISFSSNLIQNNKNENNIQNLNYNFNNFNNAQNNNNNNNTNKNTCNNYQNNKTNNHYINSSNSNSLGKNSKKTIILEIENERFIFRKISENLAKELGYNPKELIGKDLDFLMPQSLGEFHYEHVSNKFQKNISYVKQKEIYFLCKRGYCVNYLLKGIVIVTLSEKNLIYAEAKGICENAEFYNNNAFISCDSIGNLIAYDYGIINNFYVDSNFMNIIKPNFFRSFFNIEDALDVYQKELKNQVEREKQREILVKNKIFKGKKNFKRKFENEKSANGESRTINNNYAECKDKLDEFNAGKNSWKNFKIEIKLSYKQILERIRRNDFSKIFDLLRSRNSNNNNNINLNIETTDVLNANYNNNNYNGKANNTGNIELGYLDKLNHAILDLDEIVDAKNKESEGKMKNKNLNSNNNNIKNNLVGDVNKKFENTIAKDLVDESVINDSKLNSSSYLSDYEKSYKSNKDLKRKEEILSNHKSKIRKKTPEIKIRKVLENVIYIHKTAETRKEQDLQPSVWISIEKRNLSKKFFFYDLKFDFSEIKKLLFRNFLNNFNLRAFNLNFNNNNNNIYKTKKDSNNAKTKKITQHEIKLILNAFNETYNKPIPNHTDLLEDTSWPIGQEEKEHLLLHLAENLEHKFLTCKSHIFEIIKQKETKFLSDILDLVNKITITFHFKQSKIIFGDSQSQKSLEENLKIVKLFTDFYLLCIKKPKLSSVMSNTDINSMSISNNNNIINNHFFSNQNLNDFSDYNFFDYELFDMLQEKFSEFLNKNPIDIDDTEVTITLSPAFCLKKNLCFLMVFLVFYFVMNFNFDDFTNKLILYFNFSLYTIYLKMFYLKSSNAYLSAFLIKEKLIDWQIEESDLDYNIQIIRNCSDAFVNKFYNFQKIHSTYNSDLFPDTDILETYSQYNLLNSDWGNSNENKTLKFMLEIFRLQSHPPTFDKNNFLNLKLNFNIFKGANIKLNYKSFDLRNEAYLKQLKNMDAIELGSIASSADKSTFFFLENTLQPVMHNFDSLRAANEENYINFLFYNKFKIIIVLAIIFCFILTYLIYQTVVFLQNLDRIFLKYKIMFNNFYVLGDILEFKINLILDVFRDYIDKDWKKLLNEFAFKEQMDSGLQYNTDNNDLENDDYYNYNTNNNEQPIYYENNFSMNNKNNNNNFNGNQAKIVMGMAFPTAASIKENSKTVNNKNYKNNNNNNNNNSSFIGETPHERDFQENEDQNVIKVLNIDFQNEFNSKNQQNKGNKNNINNYNLNINTEIDTETNKYDNEENNYNKEHNNKNNNYGNEIKMNINNELEQRNQMLINSATENTQYNSGINGNFTTPSKKFITGKKQEAYTIKGKINNQEPCFKLNKLVEIYLKNLLFKGLENNSDANNATKIKKIKKKTDSLPDNAYLNTISLSIREYKETRLNSANGFYYKPNQTLGSTLADNVLSSTANLNTNSNLYLMNNSRKLNNSNYNFNNENSLKKLKFMDVNNPLFRKKYDSAAYSQINNTSQSNQNMLLTAGLNNNKNNNINNINNKNFLFLPNNSVQFNSSLSGSANMNFLNNNLVNASGQYNNTSVKEVYLNSDVNNNNNINSESNYGNFLNFNFPGGNKNQASSNLAHSSKNVLMSSEGNKLFSLNNNKSAAVSNTSLKKLKSENQEKHKSNNLNKKGDENQISKNKQISNNKNTNNINKNSNNKHKNQKYKSGENNPKNNLSILDEMVFENNDERILHENLMRMKSKKILSLASPSYISLIRNLIILLIVAIIAFSVAIVFYLYLYFDQIIQLHDFVNRIFIRNLRPFEIYFILRLAILKNVNIIEVENLMKNGLFTDKSYKSEFTIFEEAISLSTENFNQIVLIKKDKIAEIQKFASDLIILENNFQSRRFCEYYAYYHLNEKANTKKILLAIENNEDNSFSSQVIESAISIYKNQKNVFYETEFSHCVKNSHGLFDSGFDQFLKTTRTNIVNTLDDLRAYCVVLHQDPNRDLFFDNSKIKEFLNREVFPKIEVNFNKILLNVNNIYNEFFEITLKSFTQKLNKDYEFLFNLLFICVLFICLFFVSLVWRIIDIPNKIYAKTEEMLKNSIFYRLNSFDLNED